jgi:hypothetical protein
MIIISFVHQHCRLAHEFPVKLFITEPTENQDSRPSHWTDENVLSRLDCSFVAAIA